LQKLSKKVVPTSLSAIQKHLKFAVDQQVASMKTITIDSKAYKSLIRKIDRINDYIKESGYNNTTLEPNTSEVWVSDPEAAAILRVSKRTMQRLRSNGEITDSIRSGKVWYTLAEVQRLLPGRVVNNDKTKGGKP
jgi:hypothetical protein